MKLTFKTDVGLYGVSKERGLPLALAFDNDFDMLADGAVVGPIFKSNAPPVGNRSRRVLIGYRLR